MAKKKTMKPQIKRPSPAAASKLSKETQTMDLMKELDPRPNEIVDGTLTDEANGRYGVVTETDENKKDEAPILDIDIGKEGVHLTPEQERRVKTITLEKLVQWMKDNPGASSEEIHDVKIAYRRQIITDILKDNNVESTMSTMEARRKYSEANKSRFELLTDKAIGFQRQGLATDAIAEMLGIPESTVHMILERAAHEKHDQ